MIVLRTPKGWTGPDVVDGIQIHGTFRAHQVPLAKVRENPAHLRLLEAWLRSYRPEELFDAGGTPTELVRAANPAGALRMCATPHANGGLLTRDPAPARLPRLRRRRARPGGCAPSPPAGSARCCATSTAPTPTPSGSSAPTKPAATGSALCSRPPTGPSRNGSTDDRRVNLARRRVMEVLSEHNCHGWLEGYTLTGRHGIFATYEAFAMVSASQTVQHSKWLEEAEKLPLAGAGPQPERAADLHGLAQRPQRLLPPGAGPDPGRDQRARYQAGSTSPRTRTACSSVADHCLRSRSYVNLIVIDKQPQLQYLTIEEAVEHCARGAGVWHWAGTDDGTADPDIVLACAGDVVTMETVAAAQILRERLPGFRTRVVNVVDLMALPRRRDHPHGMGETLFKELFTDHVDVVFAFHGYPGAVHQLVHGRPDADRFHVRGFIEEGTTTTPFDMVVRNRVSRYHLVMDALNNARRTPPGPAT